MTESAWKDRKADPARVLSRAAEVISPDLNILSPSAGQALKGFLWVGVDLGTAYTVLVVLNEQDDPLIGEYRFSQVVQDGLVVDFIGAIDLLRSMKERVERHLGRELTHAASGFPPMFPW